MTQLTDEHVDVYSYQAKKEGNYHCGDAYHYFSDDSQLFVVVADGLGSGLYAKQSAEAVIDAAQKNIHSDIEDIMQACNEALQHKRGAAVTVVKFDYRKKEFTFCGVGNVKFHFVRRDGSTIYPLPVNGYLSGKGQNFKVRRYQYETPSCFILHTDGLNQMSHKKYLKMNMPLDYIYRTMVESVNNQDDTTFVIGRLK